MAFNKRKLSQQSSKRRLWVSVTSFVATFVIFVFVLSVSFFVIQGKQAIKEQTSHIAVDIEDTSMSPVSEAQFPVGVDPREKEIVENPEVDTFFVEHISDEETKVSMRGSWIDRALGKLALMNWYQNLASLSSRILVIQSGERKEQVADHFAKILGWSKEEKAEFLTRIQSDAPELEDGKFYPGTYTVERGAKPEEVATLILDSFRNEVLSRYTEDVEAVVPLKDALIIASLLEREAYDFDDMRQISGVIWNRLFTDMKLQIDATLQYAKGSKPSQPWWPKVVPSDKYIASVYNTYKNTGLPPTPIANPSLEAILAALNPRETECMFYFHDKKAGFHCTETYEEHVALLKQYYGRGK